MNAEAKASDSGASASAEGDASLTTDESRAELSDDLDKPLEPKAEAAEMALASTGPALLGARRDLSYVGPSEATCNCLAVRLGEPNDSAFQWEKGAPMIDSSRQLVVGLSSKGVSCDAEVGLGASYKGYVVSGDDVVIMVERASEGIPTMHGAVIPRPSGNGQIYVIASEKGNPFGGAVGNPAERCKLELPSTSALALASGPRASLVGADAEPEPEPEQIAESEPSEFVDVVDEDELGGDKAPSAPQTRDGFMLGFHPLGAYLMLEQRDSDAQYSGPGFGLDVLIGGSPSEGLAVGGTLGGATFPSPDYKVQGATIPSDISLNYFHVGAFVDYYTNPDSGLHLLAELAYVQLGTSGDRTEPQDIQGIAAAVGVGYDWWLSDNWSLGLLGRFTGGAMRHQQDSSDHWLLLPGLSLTATYH